MSEDSLAPQDHIQLRVVRMMGDGPQGMHTLLLQEQGGRRCVALPVGLGDAQALRAGLGEVQLTRPLPHDLTVAALRIGGTELVHVEITGPEPGGYQAELVLRDAAGQVHRVPARPVDAVALALRTGAPVVITREALLASRWVSLPPEPLSWAAPQLALAKPRRSCAPPRPALSSLMPRRPKWRM
ncbi:MAG: bifunctional nuclease family protein [Myxococcales bacterium]|nr:bifunctional nuclease family protein [Myxococcota bacterium]MDW8283412.1 bifunctional nuclease family protein [Myxococcales bacterium]